MIWIEILGYGASILTAVSLMMSKILKLRVINLIAAFAFFIYALLINAYPVFAVNFFIFFVNIYYLLKILKTKDYFTILHIDNKDSAFLQKFVNYYHDDINNLFPDFKIEKLDNLKILLILRNMIPVGIFISKPIEKDTLEIIIDYIIPDYRDFKNSIFLHSGEIKKYKEEGFKTLVASTTSGLHRKYLLKMDYIQDPENKLLFRRQI